ncbi:Clp protease N-terminal domain-containing protein [Nocardioides donggukensis]|uniref:Clp protease N-terminal domain-containing protein n=1 Tax=Nocardioides donggukensis TaxID=2774019 RepID=A0A927Q0X5_9ACTN|nr:Clp protease N-terminal domain-containing protein [Nocardioides donggukensis]MBD8869432.1 Clp protease N-terminal domain-containing protein [Nocardioides donggukensis]
MFLRTREELRTVKRLLTQAEDEARAMGDDLPGPEHLVLAALALPDRTAVEALIAVGVDEDALRVALSTAQEHALLSVGAQPFELPEADLAPGTGPYRSTPQAQRTFRTAAALAKAERPHRLRGAHVVAAAADESEHGTWARALWLLRVPPADLRAAALEAVRH